MNKCTKRKYCTSTEFSKAEAVPGVSGHGFSSSGFKMSAAEEIELDLWKSNNKMKNTMQANTFQRGRTRSKWN